MPVPPKELIGLIQDFIPFNKFLGMRVVDLRPGFARIEVPFRPELIGDPSQPALHGGVLSALADATGGLAVWTGADDPRRRLSTIDLRVDYLRPARPELVAAEGTVVRVGHRLGVVDVRLFHPERGEVVATGKGVYNVTLAKPR